MPRTGIARPPNLTATASAKPATRRQRRLFCGRRLPVKDAEVCATGSFCFHQRFHLNRFRLSVWRSCDRHSLSREFLRRLLVAELVGFLAVIQNVGGAVRFDTSDGALPIG